MSFWKRIFFDTRPTHRDDENFLDIVTPSSDAKNETPVHHSEQESSTIPKLVEAKIDERADFSTSFIKLQKLGWVSDGSVPAAPVSIPNPEANEMAPVEFFRTGWPSPLKVVRFKS